MDNISLKVLDNILRISRMAVVFLALLLAVGCGKDDQKATPETGSVTDTDNNVYKTVKIGNQWWMAENLNVKKYRNGDPLIDMGSKLDSALWNKNKEGAYFIGSLGMLYNWYAIGDTRGIAPEGWHIPSDSDWKELEEYLGMNAAEADRVNWRGTNEGNKLKIQGSGSTIWTNPINEYEVWGTNESGFSAIACGCVMFNGVLGDPGANYAGFWWTSSEQDDKEAWFRYLDYNKSGIFRFYGSKSYGFSIRCVKDN
jgi:uncharacterized protein (TIGR02145 family)